MTARRCAALDVNAHLTDKGITLRLGALVDAAIIYAPSSTKNRAGARDPEMSSTKKGNDRYFGMKAHIGVDADSGVTHNPETSRARLHDSQVWDELLHGDETSVWADKGYVSAEREAAFRGRGMVWGVMRKATKGGKLHPLDERANHIIAMVRAKVEHPFRVIKRQFGHLKTGYCGLAKNRPALHPVRARQPVPGTPPADDMRTSLPGNHATAVMAARNPQNRPKSKIEQATQPSGDQPGAAEAVDQTLFKWQHCRRPEFSHQAHKRPLFESDQPLCRAREKSKRLVMSWPKRLDLGPPSPTTMGGQRLRHRGYRHVSGINFASSRPSVNQAVLRTCSALRRRVN